MYGKQRGYGLTLAYVWETGWLWGFELEMQVRSTRG